MARKLQVFVSSTYLDLKEERQAAVQAILTAGHIPAGMELFAAGDRSQWDVIKRWIDDSDVLLLILGARYGSIEEESGKSYTHLEYDYAIETNTPVFAVIMDDEEKLRRVRAAGSPDTIVEMNHPHLFRDFRQEVMSRMARRWSSPAEVKVAIHESMRLFADRSDLTGWVRADKAVDPAQLVAQSERHSNEIERLLEERRELEKANELLQRQLTADPIARVELAVERWIALLLSRSISVDIVASIEEGIPHLGDRMQSASEVLPFSVPADKSAFNSLHFMWAVRQDLHFGTFPPRVARFVFDDLAYLGLVDRSSHQTEMNSSYGDEVYVETDYKYVLNDQGRSLLHFLELKTVESHQVETA